MGKRGPKPTEIDWDEAAKLASYQCTQKEVADFFGVSVDTLEDACERDLRMKLSAFWEKNKGVGRTKLKKKQFDMAMQGNTAMAIWLGKQTLGQKDKAVDEEILEAIQASGLTREAGIELLRNVAKVNALERQKKISTFEEFCRKADYPKPFPKQLEMKDFILNETVPRMLLGARGYGKTDYCVLMGLAYELYVDPTSTTLILTKSTERNAAILNEIRMACEKNGVMFEKSNSKCLRVMGHIGKDHNVSAVTIRTVSLRGRHPRRLLFDDPVTEDDTSEATRVLVEKKWNEALKLSDNAAVIGQPAHKYDLYGKLRGVIKTMEVPHGSIPELDHDLEAQRAAGVSEASIQASYYLKILPEGSTPFDRVKYLDAFPTGSSAVAFIDPSHKGGDMTAITIFKQHMDGIAVVGFEWKKAWNHCLDDMAPHLKKYSVKRIAIETNNLGDMPVDLLRQAFGKDMGVVGVNSTTNKHSRIMAAGAYAHLIHISKESHPSYVKHVVQYEYNAEPDDAPDSLATGLQWIGLIRGK